MGKPVYFDFAATTPVDSRVVAEMTKYLGDEGAYGNPASTLHAFGQAAEAAVERARSELAELVGCDPRELIFTSGATESNNLVLKGVAEASGEPIHIVTTSSEHKATIAAAESLQRHGHSVSYVPPEPSGVVDIERLTRELQPNTKLMSILHVNNETGVIQDVEQIGRLAQSRGILFHVDAAQSVGKVPIALRSLPIDFLSLSAHKFYGPKGIGALFVSRYAQQHLRPMIDGGGQEHGLRSGTLPTHQIVGLGMAARIAQESLADDRDWLERLMARLLSALEPLGDFEINGDRRHCVPNIINLSFPGVDADALLISMRDEFALSSSSACTTGTIEASHVLRSMGIEGDRLYGGIRISLGRVTTELDVDRLAQRLAEEVSRIQALESEPVHEAI